MPNIFLCVAWPLIIMLTGMAYVYLKKKYEPAMALRITGIIGIVAAFVIANIIGVWFSQGHFSIGEIFINLFYIFSPWIPT